MAIWFPESTAKRFHCCLPDLKRKRQRHLPSHKSTDALIDAPVLLLRLFQAYIFRRINAFSISVLLFFIRIQMPFAPNLDLIQTNPAICRIWRPRAIWRIRDRDGPESSFCLCRALKFFPCPRRQAQMKTRRNFQQSFLVSPTWGLRRHPFGRATWERPVSLIL